jgi:hypothetical protein
MEKVPEGKYHLHNAIKNYSKSDDAELMHIVDYILDHDVMINMPDEFSRTRTCSNTAIK